MPDAPVDYTAQALRTESPITPALQTRLQHQARLVHAVLGLQTEAGELADPVKKHIYYGRPLDLVNLREEIGDCLWYLAIAADALGTTLEAEQARNLAKLRARYPHVFTAEAAQVRDLDREREVLEEDVADDPHTLRQQLAAARAESVAMRKQLDEALKLIADVNTAGLQLWDKLQIANKAAAELIVERHAARAEIETLRKELANAQRELSEQGQSHSVELQQETADLRQQLDAARAAVTLQRAGIERLRAFVGKVRAARDEHNGLDRDARLEAALAELDAGTEPATVAEPAPCPECGRFRVLVSKMHLIVDDSRASNGVRVDRIKDALAEFHVQSALAELDAEPTEPAPVAEPAPCPECVLSEEMQDAVPPTWAPLVWDLRRRLRESQQELGRELLDAEARGHKLERLQAFVAEVRQARDDYQWPDSWDAILNALAELDAEPAPVAEPARCPECERLRAELENANKHCADLVLFVDTVRKCFRVWGSDDTFIHSVSHALSELDKSNPSVTLTSSTPTPVAKPVDAEGGQ